MPEDNNKENLTSGGYRQDAQNRINKLKGEWKTFGRTGIIATVAAIAIIVGSIAWFYVNDKVGLTGTDIHASGGEYDLAAGGQETDKGVYDSLLDVPQGKKIILDDGISYMATDDSNTAITWAITKNSNVLNNAELGLEPGASGSITFYIIPHKDGLLSVNLNLTITGYTGDETIKSSANLKEIDSAAQQLLEGHLLLFAGYDKGSNTYKGWISDDATSWTISLDDKDSVSLSRNEIGNIVWTAENAKKETAYPVTVYWIWPEVLESYLVKSGSYAGSRPILFAQDQTDGAVSSPDVLPKDLYKTMSKVDGTSNRYFRWDNTETFRENVNESKLSGMRTRFNPVVYGSMTSYYNSADQYLGENVRYARLKVESR